MINIFQVTIDLGLKIRYIVAAEKVTLVSSAYILGEPTFKKFGRSFI